MHTSIPLSIQSCASVFAPADAANQEPHEAKTRERRRLRVAMGDVIGLLLRPGAPVHVWYVI